MPNNGVCVDDDNEEWGAYRTTNSEMFEELKEECDADDYCAGFAYSRMKQQQNILSYTFIHIYIYIIHIYNRIVLFFSVQY